MKLQVDNLSFSFDDVQPIIQSIQLQVKHGEFVGIVGPNGSGKSTILKHVYRALKPHSGVLLLDGEDLLTMRTKKAAQKIGVLGQENTVPFDFKVEEIVAMGRSPHKKWFESDNNADQLIVKKAIQHVGMEKKSGEDYRHLSGGEKQRTLLARVLAQQTELLLLDEPTNHLDIYYQLQMFDLIQRLGVTVLTAIHDLNMAALYCDRVYVLKDGCLYQNGTPEEVFTPQLIREVYGVDADILIHPITNKVSITYLPESIS